MSDRRVLYVEDNEYNRKIVRQLLSRTSYRLLEAMDGEEGVAMAQRELPDLILMDVQLPKLSGLDATRRLRADPRTAHIPLVVVTSFALSGDGQRAMDAGCVHPALQEHCVRYIALYKDGTEIARVYLHPVFSYPTATFTIALDEGGTLRALAEPTHSAAWESSKKITVTR